MIGLGSAQKDNTSQEINYLPFLYLMFPGEGKHWYLYLWIEFNVHFSIILELWVTSLSDTPRLQYYDFQTLEYMYISKLPMKN